jgi:hypothetical protein
VTAACGLINDVFCVWFDKWRLPPAAWLMASFACALIDGFLSQEMATSVRFMIGGLYPKE